MVDEREWQLSISLVDKTIAGQPVRKAHLSVSTSLCLPSAFDHYMNESDAVNTQQEKQTIQSVRQFVSLNMQYNTSLGAHYYDISITNRLVLYPPTSSQSHNKNQKSLEISTCVADCIGLMFELLMVEMVDDWLSYGRLQWNISKDKLESMNWDSVLVSSQLITAIQNALEQITSKKKSTTKSTIDRLMIDIDHGFNESHQHVEQTESTAQQDSRPHETVLYDCRETSNFSCSTFNCSSQLYMIMQRAIIKGFSGKILGIEVIQTNIFTSCNSFDSNTQFFQDQQPLLFHGPTKYDSFLSLLQMAHDRAQSIDFPTMLPQDKWTVSLNLPNIFHAKEYSMLIEKVLLLTSPDHRGDFNVHLELPNLTSPQNISDHLKRFPWEWQSETSAIDFLLSIATRPQSKPQHQRQHCSSGFNRPMKKQCNTEPDEPMKKNSHAESIGLMNKSCNSESLDSTVHPCTYKNIKCLTIEMTHNKDAALQLKLLFQLFPNLQSLHILVNLSRIPQIILLQDQSIRTLLDNLCSENNVSLTIILISWKPDPLFLQPCLGAMDQEEFSNSLAMALPLYSNEKQEGKNNTNNYLGQIESLLLLTKGLKSLIRLQLWLTQCSFHVVLLNEPLRQLVTAFQQHNPKLMSIELVLKPGMLVRATKCNLITTESKKEEAEDTNMDVNRRYSYQPLPVAIQFAFFWSHYHTTTDTSANNSGRKSANSSTDSLSNASADTPANSSSDNSADKIPPTLWYSDCSASVSSVQLDVHPVKRPFKSTLHAQVIAILSHPPFHQLIIGKSINGHYKNHNEAKDDHLSTSCKKGSFLRWEVWLEVFQFLPKGNIPIPRGNRTIYLSKEIKHSE